MRRIVFFRMNVMTLITAPADISSKDLPLRVACSRLTYIDPLNHRQVTLLRHHRARGNGERMKRALHLTINGIATGLRNSG